jgi:hypothetical protein
MPAVDLSQFQLGKKAAKRDPRTLKLAAYLPETPPVAPANRSWSSAVSKWPMLSNDVLADCTIAAALHMQECWCANSKSRVCTPTNDEALEAYERVCGYDPKNADTTDNGGVILDVLNAWRKDGIGGKTIDAFVEVNRKDRNSVKLAIDFFGGLDIGILLPVSAQKQKIWRYRPDQPGFELNSWGGHSVSIVNYSAIDLTCVTWGTLMKMSWPFFDEYCDEAFAAISEDWFDQNKKTPAGLDLATLQADLKIVTN